MRDHGDGTESTVSRDGVTVYQTYQEERFGVPTVVLKLVSEREGGADVRLTVDLLPDLHIEEVGFHPDYRREDWSVDADRLTFATGLGPDEEVTTMYAVESLADDQLEALLDNLSIDRVASAGPESDSGFDPHPARRSDRSTGAPAAHEADGDPTAEDLQAQVETYPADEEPEEVSAESVDFSTDADEMLIDPTDAADADPPAEADEATESVEADDGSDTAWDDDPGETAATEAGEAVPDTGTESEGLASEAEETTADVETDTEEATADVEADVGDTEETEDVAEAETAQESVEEEATVETAPLAEDTADEDAISAVADADEKSLSDYSTAELVAELDQRVHAGGFTDQDRERLYGLLLGEAEGATVSDELRVAHLQKRVSDIEASMEAVNDFDDQHGSMAEAFADLQADLSALGQRVDSIDSKVSRQTDRVDDLEDGQEALESEVSALTTWRERVRSTLGALGDE